MGRNSQIETYKRKLRRAERFVADIQSQEIQPRQFQWSLF